MKIKKKSGKATVIFLNHIAIKLTNKILSFPRQRQKTVGSLNLRKGTDDNKAGQVQ
jgi:hypothetical protein